MTELQLQPIHLPPPVSFWPGTVWLWLAIIMIIICTGKICQALYHKYITYRHKQHALRMLSDMDKRHDNHTDYLMACSQLLRRLAITYYGRHHVASLINDTWIEFLNKTANTKDFKKIKTLLITQPYQAETNYDRKLLTALVRLWIKQQPYCGKRLPIC